MDFETIADLIIHRFNIEAPHERLNALAHTTRVRTEDGAALPCYRSKLHPGRSLLAFMG